MKKKNLLSLPFIFAMGMGLFSCSMGNSSGNTSTYQNTPAVVVNSGIITSGTAVGTPYGYLSTPSLTDVSVGDCIVLYQFTIDFDHQPSNQYFTATNIDKDFISQSPIQKGDTTDIGDYTLPITNATSLVNDPSNAYYQGKIFMGISCKDKNPNLRLIYNKDYPETIYLQAKTLVPNTSDIGTVYAFDMAPLMTSSRDTTITVSGGTASGVKLKYVAVNLKFLSKVNDDGTPVYSTASNPLYIYAFNAQ